MTTQPYRSEFDDARLRTILDSSVDGILVLDWEGLIRFANPAAAGLWQRPLEMLLGEPFGFPLLTDEAVILDLPRPDGTPRVVELRVVEIVWEEQSAYLATLHDITARAREAERLARINACFLAFTADHDANINRLTALLGEMLNADSAIYNRLDGALLHARGQWRTPQDFPSVDAPEGHICYDVIRRGSTEPTVLQQLQSSPYAESDAGVRAYDLQTYVGQPVRQSGQSVGALCVVYQRDFHPSEADLKFLQLVANAVGVEEERRLVREDLQTANAEQTRMAAAEREQRVLAEALRDAAAALNSTLELNEVLAQVLEHLERVVPHDAANIMLLETESSRAFIRQQRGYSEMPEPLAAPMRSFDLPAVPGLRWMAETNAPLLISDTQTATEWTTFPETAWIRSYLGIPLLVKGRPVGFLNLDSATPGFFTETHAERLRAFSDQVGIALENAELYAALRESESNLKASQSLAHLGRWELNLRTNRLYWSDTIYEIFELDPAQFTPSYETFLAAIHPEDRKQVNQAYQTSLEDRQPYSTEHRLLLPDGRIKWLYETCRTDYDAEGQPLRSVGVVQDITERKLNEDALLRNEARLQSLVSILQYRADDIQEYLDHVLEETLRLTESKIGYIYHYDEAQRQFILNSWSREVMQECAVVNPQTCYALDATGIWGEAVRQRHPFIVNDFQAAHPLKKGYPQGHVQLQRYMTTPVFSDGKIVGVVGVANKENDYTESDLLQLQLLMDAAWKVVMRVQAERALLESKTLLDTTGGMARVGGWELDAATQEVRWTQETYRIHEVPLDYKPPLEDALAFYHPEDRPVLAAALDKALTEAESFDLELRFITAQGRSLWTRAICHPQLVDDKVIKLVGAFQDITARKQSEEALRESERYLRTILQTTVDGFWVTNGAGRFLDANDAYCAMSGYTRDELFNLYINDIDAIEAPAETAERIQRIIATGSEMFETFHRRKDGSVFAVEVAVSYLDTDGGKMVCFCRDITERKRAAEALRESEARFRSIAEQITDLIALTDGQGKILYASPAAHALFGLAPEAMQSRHFTEFLDDTVIPQAMAEFQKTQAQGMPTQSIELLMKRADGSRFVGELNGSPYQFNEQQGTLAVIRDVTDRKQAEETLRETRDYLENLLTYANAPIIVWNPDFVITRFNRAFEQLAGLQAAQAIGQPLSILFPLHSRDDSMARIRQSASERWEVVEIPILDHSTGESRVVLWNSAHIFDEDSVTLKATIAQGTDITERKQMEAALRQSLSETQQLLAASQAIVESDTFEEASRRIFDAVCAATGAISGYVALLSPDATQNDLVFLEAGGLPCDVDPDLPMPIRGLRGEAYATGEAVYHNDFMGSEWVCYMPSGHVEMRNVLFAPLQIDKQVFGVIGLANKPTDFTPDDARIATAFGNLAAMALRRFQDAQKLQNYVEHLEQLVTVKVQELEQERAKVIQAGKLAALGEMATGVAHELNQPLTSLLLDAEYLGIMAERALSGEADPSPSLEEFLEISENQVRDIERCRRIIDHLRSFGRVSNETPVPLDLNQPIRDAFILIEQRLRQHDVTVEFALAEPLPLVLAHSQKLEQVFLNLISNAEYAMAEMTRRAREGEVERPGYVKTLWIRSYTEGDRVYVAISDNGSGMSPGHLERLFEPFFTTKPVGQGTGLGLSISYGIVAEFGGEITCESAVNEGTTFKVCLPQARET